MINTKSNKNVAGIYHWFIAVSVFMITVAVFWPATRNGITNWDDPRNFIENTGYRALDQKHLRWMFVDSISLENYEPLSWLLVGLIYSLYGANPAGYHLTAVLLHALNALLFYILCIKLAATRESGPTTNVNFFAGLAALVFSLHPLRVECVAWMSGQHYVLAGTFFLLSILAYLQAHAFTQGQFTKRFWLNVSVAMYAMSLMSFPIGLLLPAVLVVLDIYPLRRFNKNIPKEASREKWAACREKIPYIFLLVADLLLMVWARSSAGSPVYSAGRTIPDYIAPYSWGAVFYVYKTLIPTHLSPHYSPPFPMNPLALPFLLSGIVVVLFSVVLITLRKRLHSVLAAWTCYLALLAPTAAIAQSGTQLVADRYSYLSCMVWPILLGGAFLAQPDVNNDCPKPRTSTAVFFSLAVVIIIGFGYLTRQQINIWSDSTYLWNHAITVDPDDTVAQNNLGEALMSQGKIEEAIQHFQRSLQLRAGHSNAENNLGMALALQGNLAGAVEYFRKAAADPRNESARKNLMRAQREITLAASELGLLKRRKAATFYHDAGLQQAQQGRFDEAVQSFRKATELDPTWAEAHNNLGAALGQKGLFNEADREFEIAIKIKRDYAGAHNNLGFSLERQGKLEEAIRHFRLAIKFNPEFSEARENLNAALKAKGLNP